MFQISSMTSCTLFKIGQIRQADLLFSFFGFNDSSCTPSMGMHNHQRHCTHETGPQARIESPATHSPWVTMQKRK